ncbi:TRAP transporter substrate-binding protein [Ohessyouella blattaphilus]|uniref:TRAP transporter substrate-binding protein n=1 Tax=Ohessyouella blattaphilus TaxID=2949333 RepID=A0ABT1EHL5_9FIRM|nr:TRAP transporter substrate-binding protein [Ohessyouella blattaphilus]MCP1110158.1 TRAP transporter substrate-binding protein [Ohessyouella blattaphilus]MCR8563552.1 TRAP transporter substrate-binding protein [Ohessyouella blattaphilus]
MKRKLISLLLIAATLVAMTACGNKGSKADDDVIVLEFGHFQNPGHAIYIAPEEFKELVEERTDGRVKINIYPASQLGSAREMMEQVSMGALDITVADASDWASTFNMPELGVFNLPFLSKDLDSQTEVIRTIVSEEVPGMLEDSQLHLLMAYSNGIRQPLTKTKPITCLEDIKGLKIRTPETKLYVDLWNSLGASTVTSAWSEAYTLLQQGVADAVEADDVGLVSQNLQEVGKYMSNIGHLGQAYLVMINEEKWNEIPEDLQKIIEECAQENQEKQLADRKQLGIDAMETIEAAGVVVNDISAEERQRMREACQPIYDEYIGYGLGDLIERMEAVNVKEAP